MHNMAANEVIADVLLYEQPTHRLHIQARVAARLRELHRAWHAIEVPA